MTLRGKMHDDVRLKFLEGAPDGGAVADVGPQKGKARVIGDRLERREIAGVSELIEDQQAILTIANKSARDGGTDKAGPAGNENSSSPPRVHPESSPRRPWPQWTDPDRGLPSAALRFEANPALRTGGVRQSHASLM